MMREKFLWLSVATLCLLLLKGAKGSSPDPDNLSSFDKSEDLLKGIRDDRIFAYYTSTSVTRLVTTTITAISTCLSTTDTPVCTGRRRKASKDGLLNFVQPDVDETELSPSIEGTSESSDQHSVGKREVLKDERTGRKFTIWSTGYTTITITSTSALTGTTVTASFLCAVPGVAASCFLG